MCALARALVVSTAALAAGCGARSTLLERDPGGTPGATALYLPDGAGCAEEQPAASAREALTPEDGGQAISVVEIYYAIECTDAGGQYLLAREVDGFREFWLGGHSCYFLGEPQPEGARYGVVRYTFTAALFDIPPEVCVGFPGSDPGVETDVTTEAMALFASLDDAKAFAASLEDAP